MTEKEMIEDIRDQLSGGEELRDVAKQYGKSCRAICRLMVEVPREQSQLSDSSESDNPEDGFVDPDFEAGLVDPDFE
jgi:hypothetical protein